MKGKEIKGYPKYTIEEDGTVWSHTKKKSKKLKPQRASQSKKGYLQVRLYNDERRPNGSKKGVLHYVHRLVWETYKGEIPEDKEIDHLNANTLDNRLENLQAVTRRENLEKYFQSETFKKVYNTTWSRLKREEYKRLYKIHGTYKKVAEITGAGEATVWRMVKDKKNKKVKVNGKWKWTSIDWTENVEVD